ncbi:MAG: peptidase M20, partial [Candidatus Acidiferrales bacterium]
MNFLDYIESRRELNLSELKDFLRIPSVSTKSEHKPDIARAAQWVADRLHGAGFSTVDIVPTKMHP